MSDKAILQEHRATLGLYVKDRSTNEVFGVISRHFLVHVERTSFIYIKTKTGYNLPLGEPVHAAAKDSMDVGLVKIHADMINFISNTKEQKFLSKEHCVRLHNEKIQSLYGKKIRKYRPYTCHYDVLTDDSFVTGTVCSEIEHQNIFVDEFLNCQILIKTKGNEPFSRPGESGTVIALNKRRNEQCVIVGMICGEHGKYTVCLYLPEVIHMLNDMYGKDLEVYNSRHLVVNAKDGNEHVSHFIPCGISVFVMCSFCAQTISKTPEQISLYTFELVDHALSLLNMKFDEVDMSELNDLLNLRQTLSDAVNRRKNLISCCVFDNDRPEYVALESGMLACDHLFSEEKVSAEKLLKKASVCIAKCRGLQLRLLCEHITYVTWCKLAFNNRASLEQMKTLLDVAIEDFLELQDSVSFPKNSLAYMYNDYSRLHMAEYNNVRQSQERNLELECSLRKSAVARAKSGSLIFRNMHMLEKTSASRSRFILAECQVAFSLLGCGDNFNVIYNEIDISDVNEAEVILKKIEHEVEDLQDLPLVQRVDYLLAICDLNYRKGKLSKAFDTCCRLQLITDKTYISGLHRTQCRISFLEQTLKRS